MVWLFVFLVDVSLIFAAIAAGSIAADYILIGVHVVILVGMIVLHVEFRLADPSYGPGDQLPWKKLRERWKR